MTITQEDHQNSEVFFARRSAGMAQLDNYSDKSPKTPKAQTSPTFAQLLRNDSPSWHSPMLVRNYDQEEDIIHPNKKSVFSRVKEKAKKLRHSLSGKKKHGFQYDNTTPSWGVTLDDDDEDDEDPEYLGAPMYESELAPENYKETARQHPRAVPVVSEKHGVPTSIKCEAEVEKHTPVHSKTITETVSEKLAPAYAAVSDATHTIASRIVSLASPKEQENHAGLLASSVAIPDTVNSAADGTNTLDWNSEIREQATSSPHKWDKGVSEIREQATSSPQKWDKGVSVKEYFMHKLEPGDDERALSQAISEAISPKKSSGDIGVVEKVRDAVTSFLRHEEPSQSTTQATNLSAIIPTSTNAEISPKITFSDTSTYLSPHIPISRSANSSPLIPISTNAHEVSEEQNLGRILQAN